MDNATQKNALLEHLIKQSKEKPRDIFELNDGRIVVNGNVFPNKEAFDNVLQVARTNIKIDNFFKKIAFWKK